MATPTSHGTSEVLFVAKKIIRAVESHPQTLVRCDEAILRTVLWEDLKHLFPTHVRQNETMPGNVWKVFKEVIQEKKYERCVMAQPWVQELCKHENVFLFDKITIDEVLNLLEPVERIENYLQISPHYLETKITHVLRIPRRIICDWFIEYMGSVLFGEVGMFADAVAVLDSRILRSMYAVFGWPLQPLPTVRCGFCSDVNSHKTVDCVRYYTDKRRRIRMAELGPTAASSLGDNIVMRITQRDLFHTMHMVYAATRGWSIEDWRKFMDNLHTNITNNPDSLNEDRYRYLPMFDEVIESDEDDKPRVLRRSKRNK